MNTNWARHWLGVNAAMTVYAAIGFTSASLVTLFSEVLHIDRAIAMGAGFLLPMAPTHLFFSSIRMMERRLKTIVEWQKKGFISPQEAALLRKRALQWYGDRLFGLKEPSDEDEHDRDTSGSSTPQAVGASQ